MFQTVVVGADDSGTARQAVAVAAEIARVHGGSLHIVTASDPKSVTIEDLPPELRLARVVHPADTLLIDLRRGQAGGSGAGGPCRHR